MWPVTPKQLVEQTTEDAAQEEENPLLLKLPVPYTFEGVCYTKLDLTGVENLTAADLIRRKRYCGAQEEPPHDGAGTGYAVLVHLRQLCHRAAA